MRSLIGKIITLVLKQRIPQIEAFKNDPYRFQESTFKSLIQAGKHTEWGKKYGYKDIKNVAEFQQQAPVLPYEHLFPYIERMLKGEQNVLWPTPIEWFSKSSGTTNDRSKFIPVSQESMQQSLFRGGKDMIALYLHNRPGTKVLEGKNLAIGGSLQTNPYWPGHFIGDVSAVMIKNLPPWAQFMRTPGLDIALMEKWEDKIEQMALQTMNDKVTSISGVPTWMVVLLKRILTMSDKKSIHEVWPGLEVFLHGAVSFKPYRELFDQMISRPNMAYMEIYNASEGYFAMQDDLSLPGEMLLLTDYGVFYEFLPLDQVDEPHPKALTLGEVEVNKNYALVITTNSGLWRYLIGDTVRFTSLNPHRITVSGRTKHYINAFGEELMVDNAETAIAKACSATRAVIKDYTVAPVYMSGKNRGCHEWVIEFERDPDSEELFNKILDDNLRILNSDYDAKRYQDIALKEPKIHAVPGNTFYNWMKKRGKLGGQHKVPRLANHRDYVDDILGMLQQTA